MEFVVFAGVLLLLFIFMIVQEFDYITENPGLQQMFEDFSWDFLRAENFNFSLDRTKQYMVI